jgi:glycosyltransferase involved in cell wall biosynthesis
MKISFVLPPDEFSHKIADEFQSFGVEVIKNHCTEDCDFLIGLSHSQLPKIKSINENNPQVPMINYNWDFYGWVDMQSNAGYNWPGYGELLKKSLEIWTPSEEVNLRTEEFLGLGHKCRIIKSYARLFDYDGEVKDGRYVYQAMRYYHKDKNIGWLKRACSELEIPLYESLHGLSEQDFHKVIAECSFLVTEYHEASTGGLTLIEAHRLGKPVMVSDSKYMGARDYFGDRAIYFNDNSYEDFKKTLKETWDNTPKLDRDECIEFTNQYKLNNMVTEMYNRLLELKGE